MERRVSENQVRVFKFGARKGALENENLALDQIWMQNKYRNALVQLDREFRARYNAIVGVDNPALDRVRAINERIKELQALIKVQRTGVQRAGWKELSHQEKNEVAALKAERAGQKPEVERIKLLTKSTRGPEIKALDGEFKEALKALKAAFADGTYIDHYGKSLDGKRLFWMNAEHIENNFTVSRSKAMREKSLLRFHGYDGEGILTCRPRVQTIAQSSRPINLALKGGASERITLAPEQVEPFLAANPGAQVVRADKLRFEKLMAGSLGGAQRVQRVISTEQAFDANNGAAFFFTLEDSDRQNDSKRRARLVRVVAHIQVGTAPKTFFALPVMLHRPLPEGGTFRSVAGKRIRVGRHYRWSLLVTVDYPSTEPACGSGVVALDPGWAMGTLPDADGRLRVGGLTDEAGRFTELALPRDFMSQVAQVNRLQSIIAKETNGIMDRVAGWLEHNEEPAVLRTHFQNATRAHGNAKRRQREAGGFRHLIKAVMVLRDGVALEDADFRLALESWYKKFRHHDEWMRNLQDQNDANKLHQYRNWAAQAAKCYKMVVIDDADLRKAAEAPAADQDKAQVAGGQRQVAAPSLLVSAFVNAFGSSGGEVRWVLGKTTRTCSECGRENPALGASREFRCGACGYSGDREFNAGRNLIKHHQQGRSKETRISTKFRKPVGETSRSEVFEKSGNHDMETAMKTDSLETVA